MPININFKIKRLSRSYKVIHSIKNSCCCCGCWGYDLCFSEKFMKLIRIYRKRLLCLFPFSISYPVAPNLVHNCLRSNVGFNRGFNIGPCLDHVRKQYWAKIVQNFATRVTQRFIWFRRITRPTIQQAYKQKSRPNTYGTKCTVFCVAYSIPHIHTNRTPTPPTQGQAEQASLDAPVGIW